MQTHIGTKGGFYVDGHALSQRAAEDLQGWGGGCFANHDAKRWNAELVLGEEHHAEKSAALNRLLLKVDVVGCDCC